MLKRGVRSRLRSKAKRGFRGYPIATLAFYGPDATRASKVAVGIMVDESGEPVALERRHSATTDVRSDPGIGAQIEVFIRDHEVRSVAMADRIMGCPHEEGIDYPMVKCAFVVHTGPTAIASPESSSDDWYRRRGAGGGVAVSRVGAGSAHE